MSSSKERVEELAMLHALEGLSLSERGELAQASQTASDPAQWQAFVDAELQAMEQSVAALQLVGLPQSSPDLSAELVAKLERDAQAALNTQASPEQSLGSAQSEVPKATGTTDSTPRPHQANAWLGWMTAIAASLALIVTLAKRGNDPIAPSFQDELAALVERQDTLQIDWALTGDELSSDAQGDVVWNNELQQGYMRFRGLPINDSSKQQYQLWIFDGARPSETPVDGGVFDVNDEGEALVPIRSKLNIDQPTLFAITLEKPGGVVVSKRERLLLAAEVK